MARNLRRRSTAVLDKQLCCEYSCIQAIPRNVPAGVQRLGILRESLNRAAGVRHFAAAIALRAIRS